MPRSTSSTAATGDSVERRQRGEARAAPRTPCRGATSSTTARPACRPAAGPGSATVSARAPELADLGALDPAAERQHERLHAVADAEHGDPELEQRRDPAAARPRAYTDAGPAREDQALRAAPARPPRRRRGAAAARRRRRARAPGARSAASTGRRSRGRRPRRRRPRARARAPRRGCSATAVPSRPAIGSAPATPSPPAPSRRAARAHADRLVALELLALGLQRRARPSARPG